MEKTYANLKKLSEKHNEAEFQAEIPVEVIEKYISREIARAGENFEMPGFRKGKVPEHIVRERLDEMELLERAADNALRTAVGQIIEDGGKAAGDGAPTPLAILGSPRLTITKIAPKNPVEFKVIFALYPEVKLPDYEKIGNEISARKNTIAVTDEEVGKAIEQLLAMVGGATGTDAPPGEGAPDMAGAAEGGPIPTPPKPQLTDEMVAKFGPFKTVAEFTEKLKENLAGDKEMQAKEMKREEIMCEIVKNAKLEVPQLLLDEEWYAFEDRRNAQLEEAKLSLEDYLKQMKKTEKELEKEERTLIEERIKTSLVFREIQRAEKIEPSEKEIQTNIAYLKLQYKDRSEDWLRETAEAVLIQEKIFAKLGLPLREEDSSSTEENLKNS